MPSSVSPFTMHFSQNPSVFRRGVFWAGGPRQAQRPLRGRKEGGEGGRKTGEEERQTFTERARKRERESGKSERGGFASLFPAAVVAKREKEGGGYARTTGGERRRRKTKRGKAFEDTKQKE